MKKVEAIIRHFKLEDVKKALTEQRHHGHDHHRGPRLRPPEGPHRDVPRHANTRSISCPRSRWKSSLPTTKLQTVLDAIVRAAQTGQVGDGKIFVSDLDDAVRIRTGESGESAV